MKTLQLENELKDFTALTNVKIDIINNGGGTYNAYALTKVDFKSGYMVSLENYEIIMPLNDLTTETLDNYSDLVGDCFAYFGLWYDSKTDLVTLDVSVHIKCLDDALTVGYANKQEAIYDILNDKVIYL